MGCPFISFLPSVAGEFVLASSALTEMKRKARLILYLLRDLFPGVPDTVEILLRFRVA